MIRMKKILFEAISANKKDKDKEIFNYSSLTDNAWNELVQNAKDFQKIYFDLENNESSGQKKTFYVEKNLRKDQPVKYEINAELYIAGGDWEWPIMYFRIELTSDYSLTNNEHEKNPEYIWDLKSDLGKGLSKNYVIIPPVEVGNKLFKEKDKWLAFNNGESYENEDKLKITDADKSNAWEWLENLLEDAIDKRHKMID